MSETVSAEQLRKILEESTCPRNHGCNVANTCMCALAEDAIEALEAALAAPSPAPAEERCARCGYPRKEHSYNGACYGLCGEFVAAQPRSPEQAVGEEHRSRVELELEERLAHSQHEMAKLHAEVERLRAALEIILANTEPDAIKHRDYDRLAKIICHCARAALAASPEPSPEQAVGEDAAERLVCKLLTEARQAGELADEDIPGIAISVMHRIADRAERSLERIRELEQALSQAGDAIELQEAEQRGFERAAGEVERLRAALRPFAQVADDERRRCSTLDRSKLVQVELGMCLRASDALFETGARAALAASPEPDESLRSAARMAQRRYGATGTEEEIMAFLQSVREAAEPGAGGEWQPIETAPKGEHGTGPRILLWDTFSVFEGFWNGGAFVTAERLQARPHVNHWRPLPAPPLAAAPQQGGDNARAS